MHDLDNKQLMKELSKDLQGSNNQAKLDVIVRENQYSKNVINVYLYTIASVYCWFLCHNTFFLGN